MATKRQEKHSELFLTPSFALLKLLAISIH